MNNALKQITEKIKTGTPIYVRPYKEPKVWGVGGIGEYWYGAEPSPKSSTAVIGKNSVPMRDILENIPEELLGKTTVAKFGKFLPLVKILTPKGRLSVQFHDRKNELWVVTGIKKKIAGGKASLIIGFSEKSVKKYGSRVKEKYGEALTKYGKALNELIDALEKAGKADALKKKRDVILAARSVVAACKGTGIGKGIGRLLAELERCRDVVESFYNYENVKVGDVIPVPQGTLHALGSGIEIVEPQIPGPTQSLEDGSTYPVRYYFPGYLREGAGKALDIGRVGEMKGEIWRRAESLVLSKKTGTRVERLPGGFEDKGMEVRRISVGKNKELTYSNIRTFHIMSVVKGSASAEIGGVSYKIPKAVPGSDMLLIPACAVTFKIKASSDSQLIDTFTP